MIRYYISHMDEKTKQRNTELYLEVRDYGEHIKSEWNGDYWVATYEFNNKIYELWDNMELGIMSEVIEYEKEEKNETINN